MWNKGSENKETKAFECVVNTEVKYIYIYIYLFIPKYVNYVVYILNIGSRGDLLYVRLSLSCIRNIFFFWK